jgi:predicted component of type VI protein secretion system
MRMTDPWTRFIGSEAGAQLEEEASRAILVLADLSGTGRRSPPLPVDRDDLDALLARLSPRLAFEPSGIGALSFASAEDFTPLGIVARSRPLQDLLRAREAGEGPLEEIAPAAAEASSGAALLEELLGEAGEAPPTRRASSGDAFDRALREIIDATPSAPRASAERHALSDAELRRRLGEVLADPSFRALEASWLGLRRLVRELETSELLRIRVIDTPRSEAPRAVADAAASWPEGERAELVVACFAYSADEADCAALAELARAAEALDCAVLADAAPALLAAAGSGELARDVAWRALQGELRGRVRLVGPRVLGREPYADDAVGAEGLGLRGDDAPPAWVGGAIFAAQALVSGTRRLEWLPSFVSEHDGERVQVGPAETALSEREVARAREAGLVVLAGIRGEDAVIVSGLG